MHTCIKLCIVSFKGKDLVTPPLQQSFLLNAVYHRTGINCVVLKTQNSQLLDNHNQNWSYGIGMVKGRHLCIKRGYILHAELDNVRT